MELPTPQVVRRYRENGVFAVRAPRSGGFSHGEGKGGSRVASVRHGEACRAVQKGGASRRKKAGVKVCVANFGGRARHSPAGGKLKKKLIKVPPQAAHRAWSAKHSPRPDCAL